MWRLPVAPALPVLLFGMACGPFAGSDDVDGGATGGSAAASSDTRGSVAASSHTSGGTTGSSSRCTASELPPPFCHVAHSYGSTLDADSEIVPRILLPLVGNQYPARLIIHVEGQYRLVDAMDFSVVHGTSEELDLRGINQRPFVGDFNGDGLPDVGVADFAHRPVRLYDGADLSVLAIGPEPAMPAHGNEFPSGAPAAAIDADGDGIDEVVTVELGHDIGLWHVRSGTLQPAALYEDIMHPCPGTFVRGNFDGAGPSDLAIATSASSCWDGLGLEDTSSFTVRLLPAPVPDSVAMLPTAPQPNQSRSVEAGDLDGDGLADLVFVDGQEVSAFRSDGVQFWPLESVATDALGMSGAGNLELGDVDGDGRSEIAIGAFTNETINDEERIYWAGELGAFHAFPPHMNIEHLVDLNGDGRAEIIATQIFPNAGREVIVYWSL